MRRTPFARLPEEEVKKLLTTATVLAAMPIRQQAKYYALAGALAAVVAFELYQYIPTEDPALTEIINKCADDLKKVGPVAVAMYGDPEAWCRNLNKPIWDLKILIEEQKKFDAKKEFEKRAAGSKRPVLGQGREVPDPTLE
jgi:hypothetical protein